MQLQIGAVFGLFSVWKQTEKFENSSFLSKCLELSKVMMIMNDDLSVKGNFNCYIEATAKWLDHTDFPIETALYYMTECIYVGIMSVNFLLNASAVLTA